MEHCNGLPTITKVEAHIGKDENVYEANRDWTKLYASVIDLMLYLESNTRPGISYAVQ